MRIACVLVLLVACGGKDGAVAPPALGAVDRSCSVDADCTLTGHLTCCDTSCGRDTGSAVNVKAWAKVGQRYAPTCQQVECAVMCAKMPDCRDEDVAVCKAGTCEKTQRASETCTKLGTTPDEYCEGPNDCTIAVEHACCPDCAAPVVNKAAAARMRLAAEKRCSADDRAKCSKVDCAARAVSCRANRCVEGM